MNKLFIIAAVFVLAVTQNSFAQDSARQTETPQLLSFYYNIKDALVAGNANAASASAQDFVTAAKSMDNSEIPENSLKALVNDAGSIAATKDLKKQREIFAGLSTGMTALARAVKLSDTPVYEAYCPMKKASWLSSSKSIKNPYYGSAMLTCGKVTDTLQ